MSKNINAKNAENTQRAAERVLVEFLCGSLRKTLRNSALKYDIFY